MARINQMIDKGNAQLQPKLLSACVCVCSQASQFRAPAPRLTSSQGVQGTQVFSFSDLSKTMLMGAHFGHVVLLVHAFRSHSMRRSDVWVLTRFGQGWKNSTLFGYIGSIFGSDPLEESIQTPDSELLPLLSGYLEGRDHFLPKING